MPAVSVVIVTYNKADTVGAAIESVLRQTFSDLEILVVDDGSTDDTADRVAAYGARVRTIRKINGGTGSARNRGIEEARGQYVAFLDGDDLWLPRKLESQMQAFQREPELIAAQCGAYCVDQALRVFETRNCVPQKDTLREFLFFGNLPAFSSTLIARKEALQQAGGFALDLVILSDWDMACRLARIGKLRSVPELLVLYRHYPKNQSRDVKIHVWSGVRSLRRFLNRNRRDPAIRALEQRAWARFYAMVAGGCMRNHDWGRGLAWTCKAVKTSPAVLPYIAGMPVRRLRRAFSDQQGRSFVSEFPYALQNIT